MLTRRTLLASNIRRCSTRRRDWAVRRLRLTEQVKRNPGRFPADFVFQLSRTARDEVVANCDHLQLAYALKGYPLMLVFPKCRRLENNDPLK